MNSSEVSRKKVRRAGSRKPASSHLSPSLREAAVRDIVRLLGEVAALPGGHAIKKRFLMRGLCRLIGADAWIWTLACQYEADKPPVYVGFMHDGFSEKRFPRYLKAVEHHASAAMTIPLVNEMRARNAHITRTIEQIDRSGRFPTFEAAHLWREAEVGTLLISMRPLDARSASGIGIYKNLPARPFTSEECRIAHIVLTEVPWLHEQGWPEDRGVTVPRLSPRQRAILNLLLDGRSRKEVGAHFALSENTVAGYQKAIYRHFGVNSHAALMRRFQQGDGGDI